MLTLRTRSIYCPVVLAFLATAAIASGCGDSDPQDKEATGAAESPIVNTGSPVAGPAVTTPIPSLGVSGTWPDSTSIHAGQYTDGADLVAGPGSDSAAWKTAATQPYTATPAFSGYLDAALGAVQTDQGTIDSGDIDAAYNAFKSVGATVTHTGSAKRLSTYAPVRGRWLKSQVDPTTLVSTNYADPTVMSELRERGARAYCSAREAERRQSTQPFKMGEVTGFGVDVLGKNIDFLVVEPTMAFTGAKRFVGSANDGAQAFEIPMVMGTRITPIRGLGLPGLGEIRYPVVLASGDSEVTTMSDMQTRLVKHCIPGGICYVVPDPYYSKQYQTVTHADAIGTADDHYTASTTIPLLKLSGLSVGMNLALNTDIGALDVHNDRLLDSSATPAGWPSLTPRSGSYGSLRCREP